MGKPIGVNRDTNSTTTALLTQITQTVADLQKQDSIKNENINHYVVICNKMSMDDLIFNHG